MLASTRKGGDHGRHDEPTESETAHARPRQTTTGLAGEARQHLYGGSRLTDRRHGADLARLGTQRVRTVPVPSHADRPAGARQAPSEIGRSENSRSFIGFALATGNGRRILQFTKFYRIRGSYSGASFERELCANDVTQRGDSAEARLSLPTMRHAQDGSLQEIQPQSAHTPQNSRIEIYEQGLLPVVPGMPQQRARAIKTETKRERQVAFLCNAQPTGVTNVQHQQ